MYGVARTEEMQSIPPTQIRSRFIVRILSRALTGFLRSRLSLRLNDSQKFTNSLRSGLAQDCLSFSHRFKRNIINFFELAAAFPRSDRVTAQQYYRRARLHPRQPRSIYFSHDTSKDPRRPGTGRKSAGEKSNYHARKCWALAVNRADSTGIVRLICYDILFSRTIAHRR